jgi:hypothetical protein
MKSSQTVERVDERTKLPRIGDRPIVVTFTLEDGTTTEVGAG